ncbi:ABC transporter permease [Streptomyces sp. NPDC059104]|uniref:ABC transporter permease n=1 Tax=Streptomyces sp. NPDC059104 TaxID=3346729 RepID=UPI0036BCAB55
MTRTPKAWPVVRESAIAGYREFRVFFTLRLWLGGWVVRLFFQVLFFSLAGLYVAGDTQISYLLVGNALAVLALEGAVVAHAASAERDQGTLTSLVLSPGSVVLSMFSRGLLRIALATASSTIVLVTVLAVMRLDFPWVRLPALLPILVLVASSCYGYGWFFGAIVYKFRNFRDTSTNLAYLLITMICGVNVPLGYWPGPVQVIAQFLPLTHGLLVVRALLGQIPPVDVPLHLLAEAAIGLCWTGLAGLLLHLFVESDRATGRLELS